MGYLKGENEMTDVYKPKVLTQKELDEGLKDLFKKQKDGGPQKFSLTPKPLREQTKKSPTSMHKPMYNPKPFSLKPTPLRELTKPMEPEPKEEEEEQPYWSAHEWEQYFLDMYHQYPDVRQYLPEWFVDAIEEDEGNNQ